MATFRIHLFTSETGDSPVEDAIARVAKSDRNTYTAIRAGLEDILAVHGANPGLTRFKRLKHVGGESVELWELRVTAGTGYRLLFAPVPDERAFVVLSVVPKSEMDKRPQRFIDEALSNLDHWLRYVHPKENRS